MKKYVVVGFDRRYAPNPELYQSQPFDSNQRACNHVGGLIGVDGLNAQRVVSKSFKGWKLHRPETNNGRLIYGYMIKIV